MEVATKANKAAPQKESSIPAHVDVALKTLRMATNMMESIDSGSVSVMSKLFKVQSDIYGTELTGGSSGNRRVFSAAVDEDAKLIANVRNIELARSKLGILADMFILATPTMLELEDAIEEIARREDQVKVDGMRIVYVNVDMGNGTEKRSERDTDSVLEALDEMITWMDTAKRKLVLMEAQMKKLKPASDRSPPDPEYGTHLWAVGLVGNAMRVMEDLKSGQVKAYGTLSKTASLVKKRMSTEDPPKTSRGRSHHSYLQSYYEAMYGYYGEYYEEEDDDSDYSDDYH